MLLQGGTFACDLLKHSGMERVVVDVVWSVGRKRVEVKVGEGGGGGGGGGGMRGVLYNDAEGASGFLMFSEKHG